MTTDILIVSYARDFRYLKFCLRSIAKFCRGFNTVHVLVPNQDVPALKELCESMGDGPPLKITGFEEWTGKGMLHHMNLVMHADFYSPANLILHFDSDCVFTGDVTPETYKVEGKPVLMYADFNWLCTSQQANLRCWQEATENAIGRPVPNETMRRHPAVHHRAVYPLARAEIKKHTGKEMVEFMQAQKNEFPQSFCEFVTLGTVAWRHLKNDYSWRNQQTEGFPESFVYQAWSHREPVEGDIAVYKKAGLI